MRSTCAGVLCAALLAVAAPAAAQNTVSSSDIQRLQDGIYDLGGELSRLRSRDANAARDYQDELDELRDEVTYLRVKVRKGESVPRSEYSSLRDRIEDLRARVSGDAGPGDSQRPASGATSPSSSTSRPPSTSASTDRPAGSRSIIPVGQQLDVRLQDTLSSGSNQVEDRFIATTVVDLLVDGREVIPAGSEMRGVVSGVNSAGRVDRKASIALIFDQITVNGRSYTMRGTVTELEGEGYKGDAAKIGTGAGIGAIIGGILGGVKGALAGILIGGGGVVAATEGQDVELPAGTILRVSLDTPPDIR
jgi:hypothetical protein